MTAAELIADVRRLGLADDPRRLAAFETAAGPLESLTARLVESGLLTAFQAEQLAAGKGSGLVLRQYVLLDQIGAGGMGQVFRARHRVLGRIDAVKLIRPGRFADSEAARRFRLEARATARCSHPNLVTVYDADEVDGVSYLAMEYVAGTDLHRLVRDRGPLPTGQACEYVRQAALGLHHAHDQGLVHRDVKPANLLLAGGCVRVTDLGLARVTDTVTEPDGPATASGAVLGTPDFISPEQCSSAAEVDRRADVYALGCTLYFLLTGRPPFPGGGTAEKLLRHLAEKPAPVRGLPSVLGKLLDAMVAKNPTDRPATAAAVAERLAPFCDRDAPTTDTPDDDPGDTGWAPSLTRTVSPVKPQPVPPITTRHVRPWILVGVGVFAILAAGVAIWSSRPTEGTHSTPTAANPHEVVQRPGSDPLVRRWRLAVSRHIHGLAGYALAYSPRGDVLVQIAGDATSIGNPCEVRVWSVANGSLGESPRWTAKGPSTARTAAFAPDGSVFAVGCGDWVKDEGGRITLWRPDSDTPIGTAEHARGVLALAFASPGRLVSGGSDGRVCVWDVSDPARPRLVAERPAHNGPVQALAFDPTGTRLATGGADGAVKMWSGKDWGEAVTMEAPLGSSVRGLVFTTAGLVAGLEERASDKFAVLRFWDTTTPAQTAREATYATENRLPIFTLTLGPDGQTALIAEKNKYGQGLVRLIDVPNRSAVGYLWGGSEQANTSYERVFAVAVSPDGQRIATTGADANLTWWEPAPNAEPPPSPY